MSAMKLDRDAAATVATMSPPENYVNHVPVLPGAAALRKCWRFTRDTHIQTRPPSHFREGFGAKSTSPIPSRDWPSVDCTAFIGMIAT